jgi:FkbM family methyltransferase
MKKLIKQWLRGRGLQVSKYPKEDLERRLIIMRNFQIDTILDVGANIGQYALGLRDHGYQGRIISFEPLQKAFAQLQLAAAGDRNWILNNYALGEEASNSVINVAGNSVSSSILNMLPAHVQSAPESQYVTTEEIEIKTVDAVYSTFCGDSNSVMMKIDTQGYEKNVIDGATESMKKIKVIQLEMSMIPLYENEMLYVEMIDYLDARGFQLFSLETGHFDEKTGQLMQVDGVFVRKNLLN